MFNIKLEWKPFKIHLPVFESSIKALSGNNYKGNSADSALTLHFEVEPTDVVKAHIQTAYDALFESGENARISKMQKRERAVNAATISIPLQNWDQLTTAERKIMMKLSLGEADLDELVSKYPQV